MAKETNYKKKAAACVRIADICARADDYPAALGWYERACELYEKHLGAEHPYIAAAYCQIGRIHLRMKNYRLACNSFEHAYNIRKAVFGPNDIKTMDALFLLADTYASVCDYDKAEDLFTKLLYVREHMLERGHEDTVATGISLALTCKAQGNMSGALHWLKYTLDLCKDEGVPYARVAYNLAELYFDTGDMETAQEWYLKSYEAFDNADYVGRCALSAQGVAKTYLRQGDYDEAARWGESALSLNRSYYGEASLQTSSSYNEAGMMCHKRGQIKRALKHYERALEINLELLGEKHTLIARSYINIASAYESLGEHEKVADYYGKALDLMETLPRDDAQMASLCNNIAVTYHRKGNYDEAMAWYTRASKLCEGNPPGLATCLGNIGGVLLALKQYDGAEEYLSKAYSMLSDNLGENHPDTASCGYNIGLLYAAKGDYAQAIAWYDRAYAHITKTLGKNNEQAKQILSMREKALKLSKQE